jgi:acyl carrier protein
MTHPKPASPSPGAGLRADATASSVIEAKLTTICEAALGGKRIYPNDNLFELGVSSLRLIEIHEQIEQEYPGRIDLTELLDFPTIAELARHLQGRAAALT